MIGARIGPSIGLAREKYIFLFRELAGYLSSLPQYAFELRRTKDLPNRGSFFSIDSATLAHLFYSRKMAWREGEALGPMFIKLFGAFTGLVRYFCEDARKSRIPSRIPWHVTD